MGRLKDISLSGAGLLMKQDKSDVGQVGQTLKVFVTEVGLIPGYIARQGKKFLGVKFILEPGVERDLLIRKLFTSGLVATTVSATAWSATTAILKSIWSAPTAPREAAGAVIVKEAVVPAKLAAQSLLVPPRAALNDWSDLAIQRREVA